MDDAVTARPMLRDVLTAVRRVGTRIARVGQRWSPRVRIGLAIDRTAVRAVGIQFGRVAWGAETPIGASDSVEDAVVASLASRPGRHAWTAAVFTPSVAVALGPAYAQTKRLVGLPPLSDAALVARTVQEHVGRFFLKNGIPLVTTAVRSDGMGGTWAAAFDQPVLTSLAAACVRVRVRLRGVVPAVDVLASGLAGLSDATVLWPDGDAAVAVTWAAGRLAAVRRATSAW
jgi:hypothetical protein